MSLKNPIVLLVVVVMVLIAVIIVVNTIQIFTAPCFPIAHQLPFLFK